VAAIAESAKCRRDPGFGSREHRSSQGKGPRVGCSKSQSREVTRSEDNRWIRIMGGPLDPLVGSCIRASREKARELATGIARLREVKPR
jgi:hypothetical protein